MENNFSFISDISYLNSNFAELDILVSLFKEGLFEKEELWENFKLNKTIDGLMDKINSRKKYYMSHLSLAVYNVIENGPGKNLLQEDEIYLFSGFTEIETISKIGNMLVNDNYSINPAVFPNSVQHISLCYYTILKGITNYCAAITDGLFTNLSFINFINLRTSLKNPFIVVSGEEYSTFFENNSTGILEIVPSFVAYKIIPNKSKGFTFIGKFNSLAEISKTDCYKDAKLIFCDKRSFFEIKKANNEKKVYSDYPITRENPCGIAYRLALPFALSLEGTSLVIEKADNFYYLFSVYL